MAASWDRCGVQVAAAVNDITRLAVALDATPALLSQALDWGAQVVLTHHPLGKSPRLPDTMDAHREILRLLLGRDAWLYAAHTTLDCAPGGPAGWLAEALGLTDRRILDPQGATHRIMGFYKEVAMDGFGHLALPESLGADRLHFDRDALRHAPQAISCPEPDWPRLKRLLDECPDVSSLAGAVRLTEPAVPFGYGLVGTLPGALPWDHFLDRLWELIPRSFISLAGEPPKTVQTVAYCTGSGASLAARAFAMGAHVYITGDVTHHYALDFAPLGLIVDVGHYALEEEMMRRLALTLAEQTVQEGLEVRFFSGQDPLRALVRPARSL